MGAEHEDTLKTRLRAGRRALGCWLWLDSPLAAEIVAQAGYDCVMIDLEHGPGSVRGALTLMHAVQGVGTPPLVRAPANDPVWLKRILDIGAAGVMVPAVSSRAEAEAAVSACRYPPTGTRGTAPAVIRASGYGADWQAYMKRADDELLRICQIETAAAVDAVADIAAVDGLDMLFVGPFDLSADLGRPGEPDHPQVRAAIERVEAAAKDARVLLGGIATPQRPAEAQFAAGYDLVLADGDSLLLRDAARASVAAARGAT
jgi:2-keto-3-deoxy-L-rhamnonate aldolase RhmA